MFEEGNLKEYSCHEMRVFAPDLKQKYVNLNRVENPDKDRSYLAYSKDIDNFLDQCKCPMTDLDQCPICKPEDHEGRACRHEHRNIRIAKELRRQGKGPW
jgi:hypothetical protein